MDRISHNISIVAQQSNWRLYMTRKADPAFHSFENKVLQRDGYSCQFCGFSASSHMEVVNLDHDYLNNKLGNLVTACPMCAQCCFIDAIGKSDFGGGVLIYFPELSQGELNALCHVLFSAIVCGTDASSKAKDTYRALKTRVQQLEQQLGKGLSNPSVYGQVLIDSEDDDKQNIHQEIQTRVRLLPNLKRFSPQILLWSQQGIQSLYN